MRTAAPDGRPRRAPAARERLGRASTQAVHDVLWALGAAGLGALADVTFWGLCPDCRPDV